MKKCLAGTGVLFIGMVLAVAVSAAKPPQQQIDAAKSALTMMSTTMNLLVMADSNTAPGLEVAATHQVSNMQRGLLDLRSVDTKALSGDTASAYASLLVNGSWAVAQVRDAASGLGYADLSAALDSNLNILTCIMWYQKGVDPAFSVAVDTVLNAKPPQQQIDAILAQPNQWVIQVLFAKPPQQQIDGALIINAKPPQQQCCGDVYAKPPQQQIDALYAKPPQQQIDAVYAMP